MSRITVPVSTVVEHPIESFGPVLGLELGPPLATLRSMGGWTTQSVAGVSQGEFPLWDPIVQKVLTDAEASKAFQM